MKNPIFLRQTADVATYPTVGRSSQRRFCHVAAVQLVVALTTLCLLLINISHAGVLYGPVVNPENDHLYYLLQSSTWTAAEAEAIALGGHLATVRNDAENTWLVNTFCSYGGSYQSLAIGLWDPTGQGLFNTWTSGETTTYRNWSSGEPNNIGTEIYTEIYDPGRGGEYPYHWNNYVNEASEYGTPVCGVAEVIPVSISGQVTCSCDNSPISGASLQIGDYSATSESDGSYSISGVTPGTYTATVSLQNFLTTSATITVASGQAKVTNNFKLTPSGSFYWDPSALATSPGSGGSGTWDNTSLNWWVGGTKDISWCDENVAQFVGSGGTITLGTDVIANGLIFDVDGYAVSGSSTITLDGAAPTISVSTGNASIECSIAGTSGLTYNGSGTLTLSGANTYSGDTTISSGTLTIGGEGSLGTGSYSGNIGNSGAFNYGSSALQTLSGVISGGGALIQTGSGTLTLTGINTYSGMTTINSGTLQMEGDGILGDPLSASLTMNGGTLDLGGTSQSVQAVTISDGTIQNGSLIGINFYCEAGTINAILGGNGASLLESGSGQLTLNAQNTYSGQTTIEGATLKIGMSGGIPDSTALSIYQNGVFDVSDFSTFTLLAGATFSAGGKGTTLPSAAILDAQTFSLPGNPIVLKYNPSSTSGDQQDPSLFLTQGTLVLGLNAYDIVLSGQTLGAGVYRLIQQAQGNVEAPNPYLYSLSINGGGLVQGGSAAIQIFARNVNLVVTDPNLPIPTITSPKNIVVPYESDLSVIGKVSGPGGLVPPIGTPLQIQIGNTFQMSAISDLSGDFPILLSGLQVNSVPYPMTIMFYGTPNMNPGTNDSATVTITQAVPIITWPTPPTIASGTVLGPSILDATANVSGSFTYTPPAGTLLEAGTNLLSLVFIPTDTNDYTTATDSEMVVVNVSNTLQVTALQINPSGLSVAFNHAINSAAISIYGGPADFTLIGDTSGPVGGSIIIDNEATNITFVVTNPPLLADTYTVTLVSLTNGFEDLHGSLLDGNGDGIPGDNYIGHFTIQQSTNRFLSIPSFARTPGQSVNIPAEGAGIPIMLNQGSNVLHASFSVQFDTNLLNVTGVMPGSGLPTGWTLSNSINALGHVQISLSGTNNLPSGTNILAVIQAQVPWCASYGAAGILNINSVQLNGGAIGATGLSSVELAVLPGDVDGNGDYDTNDPELIAEYSVGILDGFQAYPLIHPVILADVADQGTVSIYDASLVAQEVSGQAPPEIPSLPAPPLTIAIQTNQLLMSWPECADGYSFQRTATLGPEANWTTVTNAPVLLGNQQAIIINEPSTTQFYRLVK